MRVCECVMVLPCLGQPCVELIRHVQLVSVQWYVSHCVQGPAGTSRDQRGHLHVWQARSCSSVAKSHVGLQRSPVCTLPSAISSKPAAPGSTTTWMPDMFDPSLTCMKQNCFWSLTVLTQPLTSTVSPW